MFTQYYQPRPTNITKASARLIVQFFFFGFLPLTVWKIGWVFTIRVFEVCVRVCVRVFLYFTDASCRVSPLYDSANVLLSWICTVLVIICFKNALHHHYQLINWSILYNFYLVQCPYKHIYIYPSLFHSHGTRVSAVLTWGVISRQWYTITAHRNYE